MKFRKKPTIIDAVRYEGMADPRQQSDMLAILEGCTGWRMGSEGIVIPTANGAVIARTGDWVCRQVVNGKIDVWPCAADIFAATYGPADETSERHTNLEVKAINQAAAYLGGVVSFSQSDCAKLSAQLFEIAGNPLPQEALR